MSLNSNQTSLFNNLVEGKLSPADTQTLISWLGEDQLDTQAAQLIMNQLQLSVEGEKITPELQAMLEAKLPAILSQKLQEPVTIYRSMLSRHYWLRYAAAIIVLFGLSIFFLKSRKSSEQPDVVKHVPLKNDIAPGKEGAILTLSDGSTVTLDSLGNGVIAKQNGSSLSLNNGQLVYNPDGSVNNEVAYNTITTPNGRQFKLLLSDGTRVWLNAASSVRFPAVFNSNVRQVQATGEVYFEVAKNAGKPFRVIINDKTQIEVLGTHFNVNAYTNEATINTTLLEGSVRIFNGDEKIILSPKQQAHIDGQKKSRIKIVKNVNVEKVMAWKNGVFDFQDATLEEVMRQIERWYNVDVVYEKGIPKLEFMGKMGRDLTLSEVLRGLELSKVHFRIEGKKLVVLP